MDPYKEKKRERRIRDRERMIQHAKQVFYIIWGDYSFSPVSFQHYERFEHEAEMHARIYYNNLKACSCDICCNPRHSIWNKGKSRLTIQELKASEMEKDYENSKD